MLARSLMEVHLLTVHRILRLGEKALQGPVGVVTRMVTLDVVRVVVPHLVVDVVALRRGVLLPDQQRMHPM